MSLAKRGGYRSSSVTGLSRMAPSVLLIGPEGLFGSLVIRSERVAV